MSKKASSTIKPSDIETFHMVPYKTDVHYAGIANKIFKAVKNGIKYGLPSYYRSFMRDMSIAAALYFEDICSDLGVWRLFKKLHYERYGKILPFELDQGETLDNGLTKNGVQFVMWIALSDVHEGVVNPNSTFLQLSASIAFDILTEESKWIVPNGELRRFIYDCDFDDLYKVRDVLIWLTRFNYLSCWELGAKKLQMLKVSQIDLMCEKSASYFVDCTAPFILGCTPLSIPSKAFYADLLEERGIPDASGFVRDLEYIPIDFWKSSPKGGTVYKLVNAEGRSFAVDYGPRLTSESIKIVAASKYVYCALIKYRGKVEFNGTVAPIAKDVYDDAALVKKKLKDLERAKDSIKSTDKLQTRFFFESFEAANEYVNEKLGLEKGSTSREPTDIDLVSEKLMVSFTWQDIFIVSYERYVEAVADKNNPFYIKGLDTEAFTMFKNVEQVPDECLHDLVKNKLIPGAAYKDSQDAERGHRIVQENLDFLFRCYRRVILP